MRYTRRAILSLSGAVGSYALAGCSRRSTGNAPTVSDEVAKNRALAAETEYLEERLGSADCLQDWGTEGYVGEEEATVVGRTSDGVRVSVTNPYFYATESDESDSISHAEYLVTGDTVERVSGQDVSPC